MTPKLFKRKGKEEYQKFLDTKHLGSIIIGDYINTKIKTMLQCENGHKWSPRPNSIYSGRWCPYCYCPRNGKKIPITKKKTEEEFQQFVNTKHLGGKILGTYVNGSTKIKMQCEKGHTWNPIPYNIYHGSWCPICVKIAKSAKDIYKAQKNFILLINTNHPGSKMIGAYINSKTKIKIQCEKGHTWMQRPSDIIRRGSWCPDCKRTTNSRRAGRLPKTTEEIQQLINSKYPGSKIIAYVNNRTKAKIQCENGHIFERRIDKTLRGRWCPICLDSVIKIKENKIKENRKLKAKEKFQQYMKTHHPDGKILEDYVNTHTKIKFQCEKEHIWIARPYNISLGRWCPICYHVNGKRTEEDVQKWIDINHPGGKVSNYVNTQTKAWFQCEKEHKWMARPDRVITGRKSWCPICKGHKKGFYNTKEAVQKYLDDHHPGGKMTGDYIGSHTKTWFQCEKGHPPFMMAPHDITRKGRPSWCPICAGGHRTKEEFQKFIDAHHFGSKMIGDYVNTHTRVMIKCENGHEWLGIPNSIYRGSGWCPDCNKDIIEKICDKYTLAGQSNLANFTLASVVDITKCNGRSRKTIVRLSHGAIPPKINYKNREQSVDDFLKVATDIARQLPELLEKGFKQIIKNEIWRIRGY
jgi:thiol-disulfide isomerase/thioredoxin